MGKYPGVVPAGAGWMIHTVVAGTSHGCKLSPSFWYATLAKPTHRPLAIPNGAYFCCTASRLP